MRRTAILISAALAGPGPLHACPVCFGDSPGAAGLIQGLTWGLFILLGATFLSLAALGAAVWRIERAKTLRESRP